MPATSDPTTAPGEVNPFAAIAELFSPQLRPNPYPAYRRLRETARVSRLGPRHVLVSGHDEAVEILGDPAFGHSEAWKTADTGSGPDNSEGVLVDSSGRPIRAFFSLNPPDHTRLRRTVSKVFTPNMVANLAAYVEELVDEMITNALDAKKVDLMEVLAEPLPIAVISHMLGIPINDRPQFSLWSHAMARASDPDFMITSAVRDSAARARQEFIRYLRGLVSERRYEPTQDLLSHLVALSDAGETFTENELIITVMMLLIAGHETTSSLIGNGVLALLAHPPQYRALADSPELVERAVEEVLRYDSPAQLTVRTALEDTSIKDVAVEAGSSVLILIGAANRDPAAHANAAVFDITRDPTRHLAFGYGGHFCLGAPLARLEGRIVLRELVKRAPDMRPDGEPHWRATATLRGPSRLPVALA